MLRCQAHAPPFWHWIIRACGVSHQVNNMHFSLVVIACLQALAIAHPRARFDEYDLILPRVNQNGTNVTDHADQDVPSFRKPCVCPTPICDSRMNEESVSIHPRPPSRACWSRFLMRCKTDLSVQGFGRTSLLPQLPGRLPGAQAWCKCSLPSMVLAQDRSRPPPPDTVLALTNDIVVQAC